MSSLGIYFGPKAISIIETRGSKIVNNARILQSVISTGEIEEKVPQEVRAIEIVALFKEELRRNKIEAKEATICLSGKDLIIRTLDMPVLPRDELRSAINFEVKKYIPFRAEDLVSDFQVKLDRISRTNTVLFVGIKKEILARYISIFSQLGIKIKTIEYSAFSALRLLKLTGASNKGIIGVLGVDLQAEDETNFTVLEDGFPLFSRDITITRGSEGLEGPQELGPEAALEKLKTEMRVSLDYYHRKFLAKNIKKIFLLSDQLYRSNLEGLAQEVGLSGKFLDISRHLGSSVPYSLSSTKGFGASLSAVIKTNLRLNLLAAKEQAVFLKEQAEGLAAEVPFLLKGLKLDIRAVFAGFLICIAVAILGFYRAHGLRQELYNIKGMRPNVSTINPDSGYEELTNIDSKYKGKLNALDNLIRNQLYITELLDIVQAIMPDGSWLARFNFNKEREGGIELTLEGAVYLADSDKEFQAVNEFLSGLKGIPNFIKYFKEINIVSLQRTQPEGHKEKAVTNFVILCRP